MRTSQNASCYHMFVAAVRPVLGGLITSAYLPLNLPSWHIIYRHNPLITNKQTAFTTCSFFHHMRIPQFLTSQLETDVFLSTLFILILFIRMSSNGVSAQLQHP